MDMPTAVIGGLHVYPVKSCAGVSLQQAVLTDTGLQLDRRWMLVRPDGYFVTQRDLPMLALIQPVIQQQGITLTAPGMPSLQISGTNDTVSMEVAIWRDVCLAFDEGEEAAEWFSTFLQQSVRLVRFNDQRVRLSSREWTEELAAPNHFSDGFPVLVISSASLADLNSRLETKLPMNRFRPNIIIDGVGAYVEDATEELRGRNFALRLVKPCTRCKITTTNQATGKVEGDEPLLALAKYRRSLALKGVLFGQNAVIIRGHGATLSVGDRLDVILRPVNNRS
jgi:uncharacterized protein YcbX